MSNITDSEFWEKTANLRIHRYVTSYSWSCQWDANYKETLQQMYRCIQTGEVKWEPVEIVVETAPDCPSYG